MRGKLISTIAGTRDGQHRRGGRQPLRIIGGRGGRRAAQHNGFGPSRVLQEDERVCGCLRGCYKVVRYVIMQRRMNILESPASSPNIEPFQSRWWLVTILAWLGAEEPEVCLCAPPATHRTILLAWQVVRLHLHFPSPPTAALIALRPSRKRPSRESISTVTPLSPTGAENRDFHFMLQYSGEGDRQAGKKAVKDSPSPLVN